MEPVTSISHYTFVNTYTVFSITSELSVKRSKFIKKQNKEKEINKKRLRLVHRFSIQFFMSQNINLERSALEAHRLLVETKRITTEKKPLNSTRLDHEAMDYNFGWRFVSLPFVPFSILTLH